MAEFRLNRTNDAVFKAVFEKHPEITLSLINAFLEYQGTEQIADIEMVDREIDGDLPEDKEARLDILGKTKAGEKVNIEMQVNNLTSMAERIVYYWARNFTDLKKGEDYDQLARTISINILAYNMLDEKKSPNMHSCFEIVDRKTECKLTDKLEIHILELKKLKPQSVKEMNRVEKWAAYFSQRTPEKELEEIAETDQGIQAAMEVDDMFTKDEKARRVYELAEKSRRDRMSMINCAERKGRTEGLAEGRTEGRAEEHESMIINMLKANLSTEQVANIAKESMEYIIALQKKYQAEGIL